MRHRHLLAAIMVNKVTRTYVWPISIGNIVEVRKSHPEKYRELYTLAILKSIESSIPLSTSSYTRFSTKICSYSDMKV
jgi:hypothetical protein